MSVETRTVGTTRSSGRLQRAKSALHEAAVDGAVFGVRGAAARQAEKRGVDADRDDDVSETLVAASQVGGVNLIGVMFAIILAAAIGMVGTKVISEVNDSITDKDLSSTDDKNQTVYENATESIGSGFADAMGLTDIVFLVLMFVVVIGALFLARRAQR